MEITQALLDADSYDYLDFKNGPSYSVYGGSVRIHSWLFANGAFASSGLSQFSITGDGFVAVIEPSASATSSGPNGATKWLNFEGGVEQSQGIASNMTMDAVQIGETGMGEFFYQSPGTSAPVLTFDAPDSTYALFIKYRPVAPGSDSYPAPGDWDGEQIGIQIKNGNDLFVTVEIQGQGDRYSHRRKNPFARYKYGNLTAQPINDEYLNNPSTTGFTVAVFFNKATGYLRLVATEISWDNEWARTNDNTYYTPSVDAWNATQSIQLFPSTSDCEIQLMSVAVHESIDEARWLELLELY
jgi:hypothetical protein